MVENSLQHLNCLGPQREGWRQNVLLEKSHIIQLSGTSFCIFAWSVYIHILLYLQLL